MKRSLYLDLTLPVFNDKYLVERYCTFLKNSLKHIEKHTNIRVYFSINLFNEVHLNSESFQEVIRILKSLLESERAEITVSTSFNVPEGSNEDSITYDILYSEYFSGYYLGMPRDFEGDSCVMVKNLHTLFFPNGEISSSILNSAHLLGYKRIFVSKGFLDDSYLKYKDIQLIPVELGTKVLFDNFVTIDSMKDYFESSNSSIFYLNLFEIFNENSTNIETNFSSLIYLLDKGFSDWGFHDIDDENMKFADNYPAIFLEKISNFDKNTDNLIQLKSELVKYFFYNKSLVLEDLESFYRFPVWGDSQNEDVSSLNMFNIRLMTLLSKEVSRENLLLNQHLVTHLNDIIDRLRSSKYCNDSLYTLLSTFSDKINQK